jgi:hypothetical protein
MRVRWLSGAFAVAAGVSSLMVATAEPSSGVLTVDKLERCTNAALWSALRNVNGKPFVEFPDNDGEPHWFAVKLGTAASEKLEGTKGNDYIHGYGGNDKIRGMAGDDIICGGIGADELFGGDGRDELHGNEDGDKLVGGSDGDWLAGDQGTDTVDYDAGGAKLKLSFSSHRGRIGNQYPDYLWDLENVKGTRFDDDIDVRDGRNPRIVSTVWAGNGHDFVRGDDEDYLYGQGGGKDAGRGGNTCFHYPSQRGCTD